MQGCFLSLEMGTIRLANLYGIRYLGEFHCTSPASRWHEVIMHLIDSRVRGVVRSMVLTPKKCEF